MTHLIKSWQRPDCVRAVQTTRRLITADHVSADFDVHPHHSGPELVANLEQQFNLPHKPRFLQQVHGNTVIEYQQPLVKDFLHPADACFTRKPGIICAVMTADCLPVLLTDKKGTFVAAVHCGWRSLFDHILIKTIEAINPSNQVLAWFGPCIQQEQYEVDETFVENYLNRHPDCETAFTTVINGKSHASLYQLAEKQLQPVIESHISFTNECTYLDQRYFSWRADKTQNRMASMVWLDSL